MRILIYSESEAAKAKRAELRADGHHASLRNPQFFNPAQFDKSAELVIADNAAILEAYGAAGLKTEKLTAPEPPPMNVIEAGIAVLDEAIESLEAPKPKRGR